MTRTSTALGGATSLTLRSVAAAMAGRVALATWQGMPRSCPDDAHLLDACKAAGVRAETIPWDAPGADWASHDAVLVRTTWDYYLRHAEFLAWVQAREDEGANLWNPAPVLRWNSDKRYLGELAAKGARVVPTRYVARGVAVKLARLMDEEGWDDVVVKPVVSAGAYCTFRATRRDAPSAQRAFEELVAHDDAMVQPFVREVAQGEWSLMFFDGAFSHVALKVPAKGDFRCQEKHGGAVEAAVAAPAHIEAARRILDLVGQPLLYARVDGVLVGGAFTLMELEVLEPELFFRTSVGSAGRFVEALRTRLP